MCVCLLLQYLLHGTREEPGTLTQGGALFSLVPLVWESNPKLQGQPSGDLEPTQVCVYYCSTYYKAVREGGAKKLASENFVYFCFECACSSWQKVCGATKTSATTLMLVAQNT